MKENSPRKWVRGVETFYGVYENRKSEVMTYGGRSWNQKTIQQYDAIVLTHIIPNLEGHDQKTIGELSRQDYDETLEKFKRKGKGKPEEPFSPWEEATIEKVDYLMRAVVSIASRHNLCLDVFGPKEITRTGGGSGRKSGKEQARTKKSLTIQQEISVAKYLMKLLYSIGEAAGLLLMYALGLRNNESTGVNFGYIREFAEHPGHYYIIIPQTTDLKANTLKILGKTGNSGRKVPLSKALVKLLFRLWDLRSREAAMNGYTGNTDDLPIACKKGKPWVRCSSDDLSAAAKEMFIAIGMREEQIVELNQELLEEAQAARDEMEEDEFKEIESDPTAYLLRRNFATHLAILGLKDVEIWYVIGHKIEDEYVKRHAFNDEKLLFPLKRKLDERPILNPIISEEAIRLEPGKMISLEGSRKLVLEIPVKDLTKVKINATAREPGDEIRIRVSCELDQGEVRSDYTAYSVPLPSKPSRTIDGTHIYHDAYRDAGIEKMIDEE